MGHPGGVAGKKSRAGVVVLASRVRGLEVPGNDFLVLDPDDAVFAGGIEAEAAPPPVFGAIHQSASHGILMNVAKLLGKLAVSADIEIVKAALPDALGRVNRFMVHLAGEALLEDLKGYRWGCLLRFTHEQVKVLGHDDIAQNAEMELFTRFVENAKAQVAQDRGIQDRQPVKAAAGDEVKVIFAVIPIKAPGHFSEL